MTALTKWRMGAFAATSTNHPDGKPAQEGSFASRRRCIFGFIIQGGRNWTPLAALHVRLHDIFGNWIWIEMLPHHNWCHLECTILKKLRAYVHDPVIQNVAPSIFGTPIVKAKGILGDMANIKGSRLCFKKLNSAPSNSSSAPIQQATNQWLRTPTRGVDCCTRSTPNGQIIFLVHCHTKTKDRGRARSRDSYSWARFAQCGYSRTLLS